MSLTNERESFPAHRPYARSCLGKPERCDKASSRVICDVVQSSSSTKSSARKSLTGEDHFKARGDSAVSLIKIAAAAATNAFVVLPVNQRVSAVAGVDG